MWEESLKYSEALSRSLHSGGSGCVLSVLLLSHSSLVSEGFLFLRDHSPGHQVLCFRLGVGRETPKDVLYCWNLR